MATVTWQGDDVTNPTLWKTALNWDTGSVPTNADDVVLPAISNNCTINGTDCVCKTLTCTGYTGVLTFTASQILEVRGNVTFDNSHTLAGTGTLRLYTAANLVMDGLTFPGSIIIYHNGTTTMTEDLVISGALIDSGGPNTKISGASVRCDTLTFSGQYGLTLTAGIRLTVDTAINMSSGSYAACSIKSDNTSDILLKFDGLATAQKIAGAVFYYVDASESGVPILNWYGSTLTHTTNIYNVTAASFPAVADVESGVEYGGVDDAAANRLTGTLAGGGGGAINLDKMGAM